MTKVKRSWDLISDEKREKSIQEIIDFFAQEHDKEIGLIAAENFLDFMLQDLASDIYNKGLDDAKELIKKHSEDLDINLNLLQK